MADFYAYFYAQSGTTLLKRKKEMAPHLDNHIFHILIASTLYPGGV
jgi:hypothetical protein